METYNLEVDFFTMHVCVMTNVLAIDVDFVKLIFVKNKKKIYMSSVDCVADASRAEPNRAG